MNRRKMTNATLGYKSSFISLVLSRFEQDLLIPFVLGKNTCTETL